MKKFWLRIFLAFGFVFCIGISILCGFGFANPAIDAAVSKESFESVYIDTIVDFIVPMPTDEQVSQIESDSSTGVSNMSPYYFGSTDISANEKTVSDVSTVFFAYPSKNQSTPYCSKRVVSGSANILEGEAAVDYSLTKSAGIKVGYTLKVAFYDLEMSFSVSSITKENSFLKGQTIAMMLTPDQQSKLLSSKAKYSGAYISASDVTKCKDYLSKNYKPLGKLRDRSEFSSDEAYQQWLSTFNSHDWSEEITDCGQNYQTLSTKYINIPNSIHRNAILSMVMLFILPLFAFVALWFIPTNQKKINDYLRRTGDYRRAFLFASSGIALDDACCITAFCIIFFVKFMSSSTFVPFSSISLIFFLSLTGSLTSCIISFIFVALVFEKKKKAVRLSQPVEK